MSYFLPSLLEIYGLIVPIFLVWEGEIQPGYTITGINHDCLVKIDCHIKLIFVSVLRIICKTYCNLILLANCSYNDLYRATIWHRISLYNDLSRTTNYLYDQSDIV